MSKILQSHPAIQLPEHRDYRLMFIKSSFLCGFLALKLRSSHLHLKLYAHCVISPVNPQVTFMCLVTALDPHVSSAKKVFGGAEEGEGSVAQ